MEKQTQNTTSKEDEVFLLPQNEKKKLTCISITSWVLQILLWAGAIGLYFVDVTETKKYIYLDDEEWVRPEFIIFATFEGILYIWYVIIQFCSPTFHYLIHKRTDIKLCDKMKKLFNTPILIKFVCECYHYETRTYTTYDSKGNSSTRTESVRVVTKIDEKFFNYYSSRDVSGLFNLNYDESSITDKYYVKLELFANYNFADALTYSDYKKEKDEFYNKNLYFDTYMDFNEKSTIDGLTNYNLINITENNPCGMSVFWYVFFTLIGIAQIYKSYINSKCIYKSFTIRKIISSRYSLTTKECDIKYKKYDPVISFIDERIKLESNEFGYISNNFDLQIPTQEEIKSAEKYNDKVFNICDNNKDNKNLEYNININENDSDINSESDDALKIGLIDK